MSITGHPHLVSVWSWLLINYSFLAESLMVSNPTLLSSEVGRIIHHSDSQSLEELVLPGGADVQAKAQSLVGLFVRNDTGGSLTAHSNTAPFTLCAGIDSGPGWCCLSYLSFCIF